MYKFYYAVGNLVYFDVTYCDDRFERFLFRACKSAFDAQILADRLNEEV